MDALTDTQRLALATLRLAEANVSLHMAVLEGLACARGATADEAHAMRAERERLTATLQAVEEGALEEPERAVAAAVGVADALEAVARAFLPRLSARVPAAVA